MTVSFSLGVPRDMSGAVRRNDTRRLRKLSLHDLQKVRFLERWARICRVRRQAIAES
jgi:hypothetical protein